MSQQQAGIAEMPRRYGNRAAGNSSGGGSSSMMMLDETGLCCCEFFAFTYFTGLEKCSEKTRFIGLKTFFLNFKSPKFRLFSFFGAILFSSF